MAQFLPGFPSRRTLHFPLILIKYYSILVKEADTLLYQPQLNVKTPHSASLWFSLLSLPFSSIVRSLMFSPHNVNLFYLAFLFASPCLSSILFPTFQLGTIYICTAMCNRSLDQLPTNIHNTPHYLRFTICSSEWVRAASNSLRSEQFLWVNRTQSALSILIRPWLKWTENAKTTA
jgi:hypothetical protein